MSYATTDLGASFLATLAETDQPPSPQSLYGFKSLMKRLATHCPRLPVPAPAFRSFLDDTGKSTLHTVRRRYDFANRFFRSYLVQELDIPNPCEDIVRPGKIVAAAVRKTPASAASSAPAPALPPPAAASPDPVSGVVFSTQGVVDRYLERVRQDGVKLSTLRGYGCVLRRLERISPTLLPSVDQVYEVMGDPEYCSGNTRLQRYAVMGAFFNHVVYQKLGLGNPLSEVPRPPKVKTWKRKFTDPEIAALLEVGTPQEVAFVKLGLDCGIRVGEAASITVDRIQHDEIAIDGKKGERKVPVHPELSAELRGLANELGEIWYDERGRLNAEQLTKRFRSHAERAGITGKQTGPHTLRRSFASRWAVASGGSSHLQSILGHAELSTTEIYIDVVPAEVKRAHAQFSPAARLGLFGDPERISPCRSAPGAGLSGVYGVAAETAKRQGGEEVRLQAALEYLAQVPCAERANGRRRKVLPREVAQLVLQDLKDEYSHSAIVRRYERICKFSRAWLAAVIADGRLEAMANGELQSL